MRRITCTLATGLLGLFLLLMGLGFLWFGTKSLIRMWAWEVIVTFLMFSCALVPVRGTMIPCAVHMGKLTLKNGSEAMFRWVRTPEPVILKVYVFNVTNPEAVSEGARPNLSEIGPYVYEEIEEKINVTEMENFTLSYRLRILMNFNRRLSWPLKESDLVTVLNVPLAGAILSIYESVPEFVGLMDELWQFFYPGQRNIFITVSVRELLFDGITIDCSSRITEIYIACRALETRNTYSVRKEGKNFKYSFFHAKNGTSSEKYRVYQGILDLKQSGQLLDMNGSPLLSIWNNHYCDMINGSDGGQFPVQLDKRQRLYFFEKDLCRSVYVEFEEELKKDGVNLYKYSNTPSLFASPEENPDNACYCRSPLNLRDLAQDPDIAEVETEEDPKICFRNGILALMPCIGSPLVASFPHFYLGDESYVNYSGLNPVKELHETFINVEPKSGIAVARYKRFQFNLEVRKISDVEITSKLLDGLFPILWVEEGMELSSDLFKLLRYILVQIEVLEYGTFILIALGLSLIVFAHVLRFLIDKSILCWATRKFPGKPKISHENNEYVRKIESRSKVNTTSRILQNDENGKPFSKTSLVDNFMK